MKDKTFKNKTILVTGGTGSFGKVFIKKVLEYGVKKVIVYSRDEFKQFNMSNMPEFSQYKNKISYIIGDVRDKGRLMQAMEDVDYVVHAAAMKQVPACEYNPFEAIKTNVFGAENVIEAAIANKVEKVVALSTDKACAPINLYGATKLCSDKLFIAANTYPNNKKTRFAIVRYGNVAGSRGSVIPYFQKLVSEGASEVPITDIRMTRFWIKMEQAVSMVVDSLESMSGGELYVKKIPSMKIIDLAKAVNPKIKIKEIGIRPGEKIHEQMITASDAPNTIDMGDFYIILPQIALPETTEKYADIKRVPADFEYNSGDNELWFTIDEMKDLIKEMEK